MKAQDLKRSILQLAIQGKLVPQNPSDEPASELLKKIKAEKAELVKQGKIKKDKQESYIYKGSDNNYYEKIGDEVKDITEEIPFEIPENWEWVRIKFLCDTYTGNSIAENVKKTKYTNITEGFNYIGTKDVGFDNSVAYENGVKIPYKEEKFRFAYPEDILLCIEGGSAGRKIAILSQQVCFGNKLCNFHQYLNLSRFLYYFLQSPYFFDIFKGNIAGIIGGVSVNKIKELLLPLPPLSEQERIVKKIEELEPFIEGYGKTEVELTALNSNFPEQIKKSILQYAIQGKLVEQDPNDEPASVLLEKIKAEKQELIKQGKIKKDKQESYIYKGADNRHYEKIGSETKDITDEIPFEIPESWSWCRLNTICQINPRNAVNDDVEASFIPMNMIQDGFHNKHTFIIKKWKEIKSGFTHFMNNDIGIAKITPCFENRKSVIFTNLINGVGSGTTELHILRPYSEILPEYILLLCKTEHFIVNGVKNFTGTAGQQRINSQFVKEFLCPLPPLNEQKKIINKVSKMFEIIENL